MSKKRLERLNRTWSESLDITLKGGFPVTVWYNVAPSDDSVGLSAGIDDYEITSLKGCPVEWLKLSDKEIENLIERVEDAHFSYA